MLQRRLSKFDGCNWLTIHTNDTRIYLAGYQGKVLVHGCTFKAEWREQLFKWLEGRYEFVDWREINYGMELTQEAAVYATPDYIAE